MPSMKTMLISAAIALVVIYIDKKVGITAKLP